MGARGGQHGRSPDVPVKHPLKAWLTHPAARALLWGLALGTIVLGVGSRIAMAVIQWRSGGTPGFTWGGTMTVVFLGTASGAGGALLALASRWLARRLAGGRRWIEYPLFAALLLAVTLRGLRGSPVTSWWYFLVLVAVFGAVQAWAMRPAAAGAERRATAASVPPPPAA